MDCLFCNIPEERIIDENDLAYTIEDGFPVTKGHSLIIPKRHFAFFFEITKEELLACYELIENRRINLLVEDTDTPIRGFNLGINMGKEAGQTIFHCHIHLIPRYKGDVENPRGGVRNIIPGKGDY